MKLSLTLAATAMAALANAHGYFITPAGRQPGKAFQDACGMQAYYNMEGDINGNIQGLEQITQNQPDYNPKECHLWKCKGMKYADNTGNVKKYTAGQNVDMYFHIQAPHSGYANVSIIGLADNDIVYPDLKKWNQYALTSIPLKNSWEHFSVKMPTTLGSKCAKAGECAIQMHWNAPSINQTYQSCIDFTLSGSGKRDVDDGPTLERLHPRDFSNQI